MDIIDVKNQQNLLGNEIGDGFRIAIIGSSKILGNDSEAICIELGMRLAGLPSIVLLTGGVSGIAPAVGRSYYQSCIKNKIIPKIFHILPIGSGHWDYGTTLYGGESMEERRELLGRLAHIYISLEGGPGTMHELRVAKSNHAKIIPVARTGGCSKSYYEENINEEEVNEDWKNLNNTNISIKELIDSIISIIESYIKQTK